MKLSRREFLASSALAAGSFALGWPRVALPAARKRVSYYAPTCEVYWNEKQDFSGIKPDRVLTLAGPGRDAGKNRSLLTVAGDDGRRIRRLMVPALIHSVTVNGPDLLLQTMDEPSFFYSLDRETLSVKAVAERPAKGHIFGGHCVPFEGGRKLLVTLNSPNAGEYDSVGVYDAQTLRELSRFSSHGFQAHDLVTDGNGHVHVGHYGSYFGSGPYGFVLTKAGSEYAVGANAKGGAYPGSACQIEIASGRLVRRVSAKENGPHGHLRVTRAGEKLLTRDPPWFDSRADAGTHRAFAAGARHEGDEKDFPACAAGLGTSLEIDEKLGRVLVVRRVDAALLMGSLKDRSKELLDLKKFDPLVKHAHVVQLHPDGRHFVVSTDRGFLAFERGTNRFMKTMSFPTPMLEHSHFAIGAG